MTAHSYVARPVALFVFALGVGMTMPDWPASTMWWLGGPAQYRSYRMMQQMYEHFGAVHSS